MYSDKVMILPKVCILYIYLFAMGSLELNNAFAHCGLPCVELSEVFYFR